MSYKSDGNQNPQSAKVVKLGLNISVSGDPGTDFEIVLDDKEQKSFQSSLSREEQLDVLALEGSPTDAPKHELDKPEKREITHSTGAIPKHSKSINIEQSSDSGKMSESESLGNSSPQETSLINKIKSTMEHFDKFSDHIKEIPRLRTSPLATSTPFSDKHNSKSESSLIRAETRPRKFSHLYDYQSRTDYFKTSVKPSPPDLFLKPLPAENYYKRGIYTRFFDFEPYRHYGSDISLNRPSEYKTYGKCDIERYEGCSFLPDPPPGILKKSDSESGDKQSTSSADSVKDIKIYQSGGILIMQNFKDNMDATEKKEISEFSAKLIENCNKLKMEVGSWPEEKTSDENRNSGKMVQFDLSSFEGPKSKSGYTSSNPMKDESSSRLGSSESTSDCMKNKDISPQGTSQSQDLTSLSTQENDSFMSNPPGMSPTYASAKKLEWDSGADVGYLNLDLTKENLSTIEKIVLKGLSSDGLSEENIVYEKKSRPSSKNRSKFTMEKVTVAEDAGEESSKDDTPEKKAEATEEKTTGQGSRDSSLRKKKEKSPEENCKGDTRTKFRTETKPLPSRTPTKDSNETQPEGKSLGLSDKSVNVNTLFENLDWQTPQHRSVSRGSRSSEIHIKPTHRRPSHSPKAKTPRSKSRSSSQRLLKASKKPAHITGPLVTSYFDMGNPKNVYKKVEASPVLNEAELSREVEEIIIDQRFKIKNVGSSGRDKDKETEIPVKLESAKEAKTKSRPISASSSSNNTVLPKSDCGEQVEEKKNISGRDQMIQTSEYDRESIGVQAFASQVSSDCDFKSFRKESSKRSRKTEKQNVNTSSKNIQAFGLNASLPKQLEHPVGAEVIDNQNTKSTQFFGGPLNSLPNYHSNLVTKPGESCGRTPNVLKTKRNSEKIRVQEENEKNILANDAPKPAEPKEEDSKKVSNNENKENLITRKSSNSKRSQSNASGKNSGTGESEKKESERGSSKGKKKSISAEGSDDVSSMVLTSEVLKVHGDSIDRNIIQEKYFRSQLAELEKREMISRSTSMEIYTQEQGRTSGKEYATTGCQYSPQSRERVSGGQEAEDDSSKENSKRKHTKRASPDHSGPSEYECPNTGEGFGKSTNPEQNIETVESLPSSTQTAHSWIPGMSNSRNNSNGVGKARSFEYLPGHIYESSGNLREELPSETEKNLITSSSSDSDTARGTVSNDGGRDSEGRNTLVLENSPEKSPDSDDRMKILDKNLTLLDRAILKLWEKEAEVQNVTQSLLANLYVKSGSGDWLSLEGGGTSKTEAGDKEDGTDKFKKRIALKPSDFGVGTSKEAREKEFSIACQTEDKSPSSDPEKIFQERKALEKRISEEKKCQIQWIENEIHHLNVLRELLEKQNSPAQSWKKKRSALSITSNDTSKSEENYQKNISPEIYPRPVTPVYGCTISLAESMPPDCERPSSEHSREREPYPPQYGLAVSLSGCVRNWRRVVMLPVGVQVSLKDTDDEDGEAQTGRRIHAENVLQDGKAAKVHLEPCRSNAETQYPSTRKSPQLISSSIQANLSPTERCNRCFKGKCLCLNLSEKSSSTRSPKLNYINEECDTDRGNKTSNTTDADFLEIENDPVPHPNKIIAKHTDDPCDLSAGYAKCKSLPTSNCRCQNYPKQVSSASSRPGITCRIPCHSNIYVNCDKSEESTGCGCSKVQVKKSTNCSCHIIQIHGVNCHSSEGGCCTCTKESAMKKTENQSCQTDCESTKELIKYPEISTAKGKLQGNSYERKTSTERSSLVERMTCDPRERMEPSANASETGIVPERKTGSFEKPKTAPASCRCSKKGEKEKSKADDHPRHYFLRIQEAEIDDSNERLEQKKSLEVVTVTVPVKRAGRGKIYNGNVRQNRDTPEDNLPGQNIQSSNGCNCCGACKQLRQKQLNEFCNGSDYPMPRAEKPDSQVSLKSQRIEEKSDRMSAPYSSYENLIFYNEENCPTKENNWRGGYYPNQQAEYSNAARPGTSVPEPRSCQGCNCVHAANSPPSREMQNGYDSHKKRKGSNTNYEGDNGSFNENRLRLEEQCNRSRRDGGPPPDWNSESQQNGPRRPNAEPERYSPEFYNYNKREFMTKSELLKEEKEKKKTHQPTLQDYLSSNRPDFYNSAERRRQIISDRAKERVERHTNRMDCLMKMLQQCNQREQQPSGSKRIFTTMEMREQTLRRYRKLPEVTGKIADERKKKEYRTNRMMAEIFAKKLQNEALKGNESQDGSDWDGYLFFEPKKANEGLDGCYMRTRPSAPPSRSPKFEDFHSKFFRKTKIFNRRVKRGVRND